MGCEGSKTTKNAKTKGVEPKNEATKAKPGNTKSPTSPKGATTGKATVKAKTKK